MEEGRLLMMAVLGWDSMNLQHLNLESLFSMKKILNNDIQGRI